MQEWEIETKSAKETQEAAGKFVVEILASWEGRGARVVCLWGDLGSGKTTFTQGMAKKLGVREVINSPTFLIMKKYPLAGDYKGRNLYHFDMYRIQGKEDLWDLGWNEILAEEKNLVVVEWPEKIKEILPEERIDINFNFISQDTRRIVFRSQSKL